VLSDGPPITGVYHQYGGIKKRTITLAVVAARPPAIKKAERKIIRKIVDECRGLYMRDIVIDRFQEIGSRLCTSHLKMPARNKIWS
jgi:hypothetical protein